MKILHLSDIHFRNAYTAPKNAYERMLAKMTHPKMLVTHCLERALQAEMPDLLVITGDLVDAGTAEDYAALRMFIERLSGGLPMLITPGNHDHKAALRQGWLAEASSDEPYNAVYEGKDVVLVSFDTSEYGCGNGRLVDSQLDWLAGAMEAHKDKPILIVTHHHFDDRQANIPALQTERLWPLLHRYPVLGILNGHTHHHAQGFIHDIPYYTADGLSFCGEDCSDGCVRFEERGGYNFYVVEGGLIQRTKTETFYSGKIIDRIKGSELT